MRQGNDVGTQYRSGIYVYDAAQRAAAEASQEARYEAALKRHGLRRRSPPKSCEAPEFYFAEDYHQQYLAKNPARLLRPRRNRRRLPDRNRRRRPLSGRKRPIEIEVAGLSSPWFDRAMAKEPRRPIERMLERSIFQSRWLMAPFYLGLIVGLLILLVTFLRDLAHFA